MKGGGFISDAVFAHWICHHVERLAGANQRVNECHLVIGANRRKPKNKIRAKRRDES